MVLRICNSLKYHGSPLRTILLGKLAGLAVSAVLSSSHSVPFHGSQKDGQPRPIQSKLFQHYVQLKCEFLWDLYPIEKLHVSAFRLSLVRFPRHCLETNTQRLANRWRLAHCWAPFDHGWHWRSKVAWRFRAGAGGLFGVEIGIHKALQVSQR